MPARTRTRLDKDEERVARAQRLLIGLGAALVHTPFDTTTHDKLRRFLTDDVDQVLASLEVLRQRPEAELRARVAELAGHHLLSTGGVA
ncbi:hypothetical protein ACIBL8_21825 [Streptomyces sp. NPDC050523]|uniref:hypothetical protein n=1 Tax=Streptomyces sp. NPDC050523 TaxID=3365622 RepID=UPI00379A0F36